MERPHPSTSVCVCVGVSQKRLLHHPINCHDYENGFAHLLTGVDSVAVVRPWEGKTGKHDHPDFTFFQLEQDVCRNCGQQCRLV